MAIETELITRHAQFPLPAILSGRVSIDGIEFRLLVILVCSMKIEGINKMPKIWITNRVLTSLPNGAKEWKILIKENWMNNITKIGKNELNSIACR